MVRLDLVVNDGQAGHIRGEGRGKDRVGDAVAGFASDVGLAGQGAGEEAVHPFKVTLTVADNGVGLSGEGNDGEGLGVRLVKAQTVQLGATMTVDQPGPIPKDTSNPGLDPGGGTRGTRVTIIVPGPWYADD